MFEITPSCSWTKTSIFEEQFPAAGTVWESLELENWQNSIHWFYITYFPLEISAARLPSTVLETAVLQQYQQRRWCWCITKGVTDGQWQEMSENKVWENGGKATSCTCVPQEYSSCTGSLQCIFSANHSTAVGGEDGQGSALSFLSLHPYHVPQTKGTSSFTKYKWMLPLASFWRRWKGKKIASLMDFLLAMSLLVENRLFWAYLQNQPMYISSAAAPGNGCLPSRKTVFRQKPWPPLLYQDITCDIV